MIKIEEFIKANFSKEEYLTATSFINKHTKECLNKHHDACGALLSYTYTPTFIGDVLKIECSCGCKTSIDNIDF